jgi:dTDP-4-dehydrorhamnose reductase
MKVLILGAGGLTGRYLVREAKRRGTEVAAYTRQELDIAQPDVARETLAKVEPELVINAASVTSLEICEENTALSRKVNCEAP